VDAKLTVYLALDTRHKNKGAGRIATFAFRDKGGEAPLIHVVSYQQCHLDSAADAVEHQQSGLLRSMQRPPEIQGGIEVDLACEGDDAGVALLE